MSLMMKTSTLPDKKRKQFLLSEFFSKTEMDYKIKTLFFFGIKVSIVFSMKAATGLDLRFGIIKEMGSVYVASRHEGQYRVGFKSIQLGEARPHGSTHTHRNRQNSYYKLLVIRSELQKLFKGDDDINGYSKINLPENHGSAYIKTIRNKKEIGFMISDCDNVFSFIIKNKKKATSFITQIILILDQAITGYGDDLQKHSQLNYKKITNRIKKIDPELI